MAWYGVWVIGGHMVVGDSNDGEISVVVWRGMAYG